MQRKSDDLILMIGLLMKVCSNPLLQDDHNIIDMTAFNTDGFDVSGRNVWIHDCTIWNQVISWY